MCTTSFKAPGAAAKGSRAGLGWRVAALPFLMCHARLNELAGTFNGCRIGMPLRLEMHDWDSGSLVTIVVRVGRGVGVSEEHTTGKMERMGWECLLLFACSKCSCGLIFQVHRFWRWLMDYAYGLGWLSHAFEKLGGPAVTSRSPSPSLSLGTARTQ